MRYFRRQEGFTIVELMITIVIIGILAATAVPIYQSQLKRVKEHEADLALETIRTSLQIYYSKHQVYPKSRNFKPVDTINSIGLSSVSLNGKYFKAENYTYKSNGKLVEIRATGEGQQKGLNRKINENGDLSSF